MKSYSELMSLESFDERLDYLRLYSQNPSNENRNIMNKFYKSYAWKVVREAVIKRDLGCDLAVQNLFIGDNNETIIVHHINPITIEDVTNNSSKCLDMENLITVSSSTHNTIHYREEVEDKYVERSPGDTKLW